MTAQNKQPIVFIDTNIWVYAFSDTQDKRKTQLSRALVRRTAHIHISTQVINETTKNLLQKFNATEVVIQGLITSLYRKYHVVDLSRPILLQASSLRARYSFSFWDSTIIASALEVQAETLYSEDLQDGLTVEGRLSIKNPLK